MQRQKEVFIDLPISLQTTQEGNQASLSPYTKKKNQTPSQCKVIYPPHLLYTPVRTIETLPQIATEKEGQSKYK